MKGYTKGLETKRRIIEFAHDTLKTQTSMAITARGLADELGYTAASLYRHFDSMDKIIAVASVQFLDEYMQRYARLLDSTADGMEQYHKGWRLFNRYAFRKPDIFYNFFWGNNNNTFTEAITEYYQLFPAVRSQNYPEYFQGIISNPSIYERDYQALMIQAKSSGLSEQDMRYLSQVNPLVVRGLLQESIDQPPEIAKEKQALCNRLIEQTIAQVIYLTANRRHPE